MNLNIDVQKQNTFDAIVVGTGISGGWAAKELTEKRFKKHLCSRTAIQLTSHPATLLTVNTKPSTSELATSELQ